MDACYSTTFVSGESSVGGLVGYNLGNVTRSYWDTQTSGQTESAGGTGKMTAEMKMGKTFQAWGTCGDEGVWTIDEGRDYPRLWWENQPGDVIRLTNLSDLLVGTGTENDPFLIYTPEELNMVGLFPCESDRHFKLMGDIDLSGITYSEALVKSFSGVFDGAGHTVSHLTIEGGHNLGFFGESSGEVKNLGVVDVNVVGWGYSIGGLVGWNGGTVIHCYCTGTVSGHQFVGGIVGSNGGSIANSYITGAVRGNYGVGGLVGHNGGAVTGCYSTGLVMGDQFVGGLVGHNGYRGVGNINTSYSTGAVTGNEDVGGLVGRGNPDLVSKSFWDIQTSDQATSAGGTGKTTAEMQTASTFLEAGWDFVNVWGIGENQTYPYLRKYSAADINQDASVNLLDLAALAENWLTAVAP